MNAKTSFAFLMLAVAVVPSKEICYKSCASSCLGRINSLDVTPCDGEPCIFRQGSTKNITISFTPYDVMTSANIYAHVNDGIKIPLTFNHDACQGHGLTCPLNRFLPVKLEFPVELNGMHPSHGNHKVEVVIMNQNDQDVVCGSIEMFFV